MSENTFRGVHPDLGVHPDFFVKLVFEIAVDQQTRACD